MQLRALDITLFALSTVASVNVRHLLDEWHVAVNARIFPAISHTRSEVRQQGSSLYTTPWHSNPVKQMKRLVVILEPLPVKSHTVL